MFERLNSHEIDFIHDAAAKIARDFFQIYGRLSDGEMDAALLVAVTNIVAKNPDLAPWLIDEMVSAICDHVWKLKDDAYSRGEGAA